MPANAVSLPAPPALSLEWALFLDVDGCLLEFADDPACMVAPASLVGRLQELRTALEGALALVSGRTITMLDRMFAPAAFAAAGLHGLELRRHEDIESIGDGDPARIAEIAESARGALASFPGTRVEDKGVALALHWRGAPDAAAVAQAFATDALRQLPEYRLQPGDHVIELKPGAADKGSAIAGFLDAAPFRGRMPVFVGDDLTDEHGFAEVNGRGGISILVGSRGQSAARYQLADPSAVRSWLGVDA